MDKGQATCDEDEPANPHSEGREHEDEDEVTMRRRNIVNQTLIVSPKSRCHFIVFLNYGESSS